MLHNVNLRTAFNSQSSLFFRCSLSKIIVRHRLHPTNKNVYIYLIFILIYFELNFSLEQKILTMHVILNRIGFFKYVTCHNCAIVKNTSRS